MMDFEQWFWEQKMKASLSPYSSANIFGDPAEEARFRQWYGPIARFFGLDPNPDDPRHHYDYRSAFLSGDLPDASRHWPSRWKDDKHPNLIIDGTNTKTGRPVR